jgi:hypothetical protein
MIDQLLRDATIQEIQLELIRRASFNEFDGERVVKSLLANRKSWIAVLMDRPALAREESGLVDLIKLRDLPRNQWNVDTLYVLAPDARSGHALAKLAEEDRWTCDDVIVHDDPQHVGRALGAFPAPGGAIVEFWWD